MSSDALEAIRPRERFLVTDLVRAARRARSLDLALQHGIRLKLSVRVIVNEGRRGDIERDADTASKVERRKLDDQPWTIAEYDWRTGALHYQGLDGAFGDGDAKPSLQCFPRAI